jgi:hypothetical protein
MTYTLTFCTSGVIMYSLVTGRLPFWSPYTDHGRKQKLLDQVEKGLTDKHEAVMKNLTAGKL